MIAEQRSAKRVKPMFLKDGEWQSCINPHLSSPLPPPQSPRQPALSRSKQSAADTQALRNQLTRLLKVIEHEVIEPERKSGALRSELEFQIGVRIPHRVKCPINVSLTRRHMATLSETQATKFSSQASHQSGIEWAIQRLDPSHHRRAAEIIRALLDHEMWGEEIVEISTDPLRDQVHHTLDDLTDEYRETMWEMREAWTLPEPDLELDDLNSDFTHVVVDFLGIYRHRASSSNHASLKPYQRGEQDIQLFALPLLLDALRHHYPLCARALKVLGHEVAHFVTHRGEDILGHSWETFSHSDRYTKEGLAQHFTHQALKRLAGEGSYQRKSRVRFASAYQVYLDNVAPLSRIGFKNPYLIQNTWEHYWGSGDILEGFQRFKAERGDSVSELERLMTSLHALKRGV